MHDTNPAGRAPARQAKGVVDVEQLLPPRVERKQDDDRKHRGIRCPHCGWRPTANSLWVCRPGCEHVWNTFDTGGRCPSCRYQWLVTACLRCHEHSRHVDWYESPSDLA